MLAHAPGDLGNRLVDGGIHVLSSRVGLDHNVVCAEEDDFRYMSVLLHVEKDLGLNDFGIIEVQAGHFFLSILAHWLRDGDMTSGDSDGQIDVCDLHN